MSQHDPLADPAPLIRSVYSYVAYRLGPGPDAEDVTSEVFERALRYRSGFDPRRGEPVAWLIGIARRCLADAGRRPTDVDAVELLPGRDLEAETVHRLTVRAAVNGLDERDRELVALRYGADLTARQIGSVLGMRPNAVEVALHRALGRLRATVLEGESGGQRVAIADSRPPQVGPQRGV
jgi:RNA polymerase sigma factor (sigma-70 family)